MKKMYKKVSLSSRLVNFVLKMINYKEKFTSVENTKKNIERISSMYGVEKDEFIKMIGGDEMIKYDVKMRKALDFLKNN